MTITSFTYLLFLAAGVFIYYLLPRKWQWVELLGLSILLYCGYTVHPDLYTDCHGSSVFRHGLFGKGRQEGSNSRSDRGSDQCGAVVCPKRVCSMGTAFSGNGDHCESAGGSSWHGILYAAGSRIYFGLLLGEQQTAEEPFAAFAVLMLFPTDDHGSHQPVPRTGRYV